jgi:hypothetical protein
MLEPITSSTACSQHTIKQHAKSQQNMAFNAEPILLIMAMQLTLPIACPGLTAFCSPLKWDQAAAAAAAAS